MLCSSFFRDEETSSPAMQVENMEVDFGDMGDEVQPMMGEEGEEEVEEAPRINVDIPRCIAHLGSELYFVKLPNFLSVETR